MIALKSAIFCLLADKRRRPTRRRRQGEQSQAPRATNNPECCYQEPGPPLPSHAMRHLFDMLFADIDEADLDRVALVDAARGVQTTYRELIGRVKATAGALAARGIGVGDVVGLLSPNSSTFAVAFHGILRAGATATTINALFTAKDIAKQLADAKATMLITVGLLLPPAEEAAQVVGI